MTDGLKNKYRKAIIEILSANERVEKVVLFGSRAMGTFTPTSDVDIALFGDQLTMTDQAKLAEAIDELSIPQRVDILLYKSIKNEKLIEHIKRHGVEWYRRSWAVGSEWLETTLGKTANLKNGKGLKNSFYDDNGKYPVWGANGQIARTDLLLNQQPVVVIGRVGVYCGSIHAVFEPNWVTDNAIVATPKEGNDFRFLYYLLKYIRPERTSIGSAQPLVTQTGLKILKHLRPPLSEQRAIAHILGSLDDKIELNRRMNETLEAMARAIFKSWFIDFDPVRARRGDPMWSPTKGADTKVCPYMTREILNLFPDNFQDSDLGEIPKGWEPSTIGSDFNLTMGQSPPGKTYNETGDGLPFFQGRRDFGFRFPTNRVYCTAPKRLAGHGDTLVSVRAPVGDINMAMARCCVGRGVAGIRHKSGSRSYTYCAMHTLSDRFARFEAEGTVFGAINKKQFEGLRWLSPPGDMVNEFEKIAFSLDERIEKNTNEIVTLASLRDTLLPKLISGELRLPAAALAELAAQTGVSDAEKFVEPACAMHTDMEASK
ncbi:MAG: hypothetical protein C4B58_11520 [Deltaproteobacteria bacterium]|nr:MAG: hypothetical protein C4B58_11520 [Deltaproteobacteria bacterium]